MVIVKIFGGLGNQMFQYAAARRLAYKLNVELKLDISWFKNRTYKRDDQKRKYSLGNFNILEEFINYNEIKFFIFPYLSILNKFEKMLYKIRRGKLLYIKEKYFHFNPKILDLPDNIYLDGYWQNEKYFLDVKGIIINEFKVKNPILGRNKEVFEKIRLSESVSIHIRRGDYITNPRVAKKLGGICDFNYFFRSIDYIGKKIKNPVFFFFSDDINWVKENFAIKHPCVFIDFNNILNSYEDMRLMSQCKHNIISNSSFSWWGAWLNPNSNKIVIAPRKWFNDFSKNTSTLIPSNWLRF